jgi:hypothetical protein
MQIEWLCCASVRVRCISGLCTRRTVRQALASTGYVIYELVV